MANYIITPKQEVFEKIGNYNYCQLEDMVLPRRIALDTETTALSARDGVIFSIQIGTGKDNYLIDVQDYGTDLFEEETISVHDVIPYLKGRELVLQNAIFDLGFFYSYGFYPEKIWDTMIASKIYYNGNRRIYSHSFGAIMKRELGIVYDKTEQKNIHKVRLSTKAAIHYCFQDVDRLLECHDVLYNKLKKYDALETYALNCKDALATAYMEQCGMAINTEKWKAKMQVDLEQKKIHERTVTDYIFDNLPQHRNNQLDLFNFNKEIRPLLTSPKQMIQVFEDFEINVLTDEGKKSIDSSVINKSKHPFVDLWLKYKEYDHRVSNQGQKILDKVIDGRVYTRFNQILDTCRMSTRSGEINFLNFPSDHMTRDCFEVQAPNYMIVADYEGQENACTADNTNDEVMVKAVTEGLDQNKNYKRSLIVVILLANFFNCWNFLRVL